MKSARPFALLAAGVAGVALLLAGCGGTAPTRQANQRWANAACTSVLAWKKELHQAEASLNLGYSPSARLNDAVAATRRLAKQLARLGLPTTQPTRNPGPGSTKRASDLQEQITNVWLAALKTKACRQLGGAPM